MQLEKIISISGKPGLFRLVSQLRTGFIIEDIITHKKANISNTSQVSLLDNISMFTFESEVPLFEVFHHIAKKEDFKSTINHKSSGEDLRIFMSQVLPNYDVDRVYESDIKKLVQWYNILEKAGYIKPENFTALNAENEETPEAEEVKTKKAPAKKTEKTAAEKPAKKSTKKKIEE
ncbi:hypothetical protein GNY06_07210 [Elizabethkingia argentiflava]|uniref:DUF5606 domain-containing protein n=1 Tax=Elizabethkingia argenteiflava TaxID=2681556 RepID=A0A845PSG8_9FLAO|nr:DUF5606 domain-containing protein [Elizabethkingia argenteiflava]NAW51172.1 hypothetical protein [Elizabethkingia argenteiflava]